MITLNTLFGVLAPQQCLACGQEGSVLCDSCVDVAGEPIPPRCAGCKQLSEDWRVCSSCRSWLPIESIRVVAPYDGIYESLLHAYKFDLQRDAAKPLASMLSELLANGKYQEFTLTALPTAPARIRARGFDNGRLLERTLAAKTGMNHSSVLRRHSNVRQLGSSRAQRIRQMEQEFYAPDTTIIKDKSFLLLDDVMTTGASLAAAAKTLKKAGARHVVAIIFAQKM